MYSQILVKLIMISINLQTQCITDVADGDDGSSANKLENILVIQRLWPSDPILYQFCIRRSRETSQLCKFSVSGIEKS